MTHLHFILSLISTCFCKQGFNSLGCIFFSLCCYGLSFSYISFFPFQNCLSTSSIVCLHPKFIFSLSASLFLCFREKKKFLTWKRDIWTDSPKAINLLLICLELSFSLLQWGRTESAVKFISFQEDIWIEFLKMIVLFAVPRSSVITATVVQMIAEVTLKHQANARYFCEATIGSK